MGRERASTALLFSLACDFFPFDGLCSCTCTATQQVFFQTELAAGRKDAGDQMAQRIRRQLCRALKTLEPMVGEGSRYTSAFSALRAQTAHRALAAVRLPRSVLELACRVGICRMVVTRNLLPAEEHYDTRGDLANVLQRFEIIFLC